MLTSRGQAKERGEVGRLINGGGGGKGEDWRSVVPISLVVTT